MPQLLGRMDADVVGALKFETERLGIEILTDVKILGISKGDAGHQVSFEHGGQEAKISASVVANGTGRVADVGGLDLEAANVTHDRGRIAVTEHLRSKSNPGVYVAGDALWSSPQLSPVATYEGRIVGENIVNGDSQIPDYSSIPSAVYTVPALASVGFTEDDAIKHGLEFERKVNQMTSWRSARTYAETAAFAKVLVERESGKILGAHMVGDGAEEVIHLFALAIKHGITAGELSTNVYAYPTFSSDLKFLV